MQKCLQKLHKQFLSPHKAIWGCNFITRHFNIQLPTGAEIPVQDRENVVHLITTSIPSRTTDSPRVITLSTIKIKSTYGFQFDVAHTHLHCYTVAIAHLPIPA